MIIVLLTVGFFIGFILSIPIGPVAIVCLKHTIMKGRRSGFVSGLGAATADFIYALVATLGISIVYTFILHHQYSFQIVSVVLLLYVGARLLREKEQLRVEVKNRTKNLIEDYFTTLAFTLANPMNVLLFMAVFANIGVTRVISHHVIDILPLAMGVFIGSATWWYVLSTVGQKIYMRFQTRTFTKIRYFSGIAILCFAGILLISLALHITFPPSHYQFDAPAYGQYFSIKTH